MAAIVLSYLALVYLIFVPRFLTPLMLAVAFAYRSARLALQRLSNPRPEGPPPGYRIWPRWFSTVCFVHNRVFSNYFVLGLVADTVVRTLFAAVWR